MKHRVTKLKNKKKNDLLFEKEHVNKECTVCGELTRMACFDCRKPLCPECEDGDKCPCRIIIQ